MTLFDTRKMDERHRGICKLIKDDPEMRQEVIELMEKTDGTGNEFGISIVEHDGELYKLGEVEGNEASIASSMVKELKYERGDLDFKINARDDDLHILHTHPNGFPDMSFQDVVSHLNQVGKPLHFSSSLVASRDALNNGILLNGIEKTREIGDEEIKELKSAIGAIVNMVRDNKRPQSFAKLDLWEYAKDHHRRCQADLTE